MDFRDQFVKDTLDKTVGRFEPEKGRSRAARIAIVAALAVATCVGFWTILYFSSPKHARQTAESKPVAVELLRPQEKR